MHDLVQEPARFGLGLVQREDGVHVVLVEHVSRGALQHKHLPAIPPVEDFLDRVNHAPAGDHVTLVAVVLDVRDDIIARGIREVDLVPLWRGFRLERQPRVVEVGSGAAEGVDLELGDSFDGEVGEQAVDDHGGDDAALGVADEDDFADRGIDQVGFDVLVGDAGVLGVVGPAALDEAFEEVVEKAVAKGAKSVTYLSTMEIMHYL